MHDSNLAPPIPSAFIWRRAHSLTGIWLVLFLMEHLLVNSQAALWIGEDGHGFVTAVNSIKNLPYLPVIEILLLAIPFLVHMVWGVRYLLTAKYNVWQTDGSSPSLPDYRGNKAYTWQRITSWILLFGIIAHVIQMRFLEYPVFATIGTEKNYIVEISNDPGLIPLSARLDFKIFTPGEIEQHIANILNDNQDVEEFLEGHPKLVKEETLMTHGYKETLESFELKENSRLAITPSFGTAELLMVRDVFKSPTMIFLYTGLVLAACFHAFNGLWTFMISWGFTMTARSQIWMRGIATGLMIVVAFLGLIAIYGTYWLNLKA